MLLTQGEARSHDIDRNLACTLAAVAGALNTAAFHAVGFFSANMTGNVSSLSNHAADGEWWTGLFYLGIVLVFIGGASASTLLISAGRRRGIDGIYAIGILAEAVLMGLLGLFEWLVPSLERGPVLILGLSFLMGIQNAVVTRISDARVRTTHVSGMSTDIGIELGVLFDMLRGRESRGEAAVYGARLRLHAFTVLSFLVGGVAGVLIYREIGILLLFVAAAMLFVLSSRALFRAKAWTGRPPVKP
jgi:uncharacterized membrane protein YoaK (UPF0700 family)